MADVSEDDLRIDIERALAAHITDPTAMTAASRALAESALYDRTGGRQLLAVSKGSGEIVQYDVAKAAFAVAGVLGAGIPLLTGPIGVASVLSAVSALGALQGLTRRVPESAALVVMCLLPTTTMPREELESAFATVTADDTSPSHNNLADALAQLQDMGVIRVKDGTVRLVERVFVRR